MPCHSPLVLRHLRWGWEPQAFGHPCEEGGHWNVLPGQPPPPPSTSPQVIDLDFLHPHSESLSFPCTSLLPTTSGFPPQGLEVRVTPIAL